MIISKITQHARGKIVQLKRYATHYDTKTERDVTSFIIMYHVFVLA
jgi:hypothetical protein